ncbi:MAG: universal stress protein [Calditrichaeota bacterium]|nr:MAG: universal stress protein [Calditrichota bacterium]
MKGFKMLKIKKILYTTDFSECADQALQHALFLAKKYKANLDILHATVFYGNYESLFSVDQYPDWQTYFDSVEKSLDSMIDKSLLPFDTQKINITKIQKRGTTPAHVILDHILKNEVDLVVMGTHGRPHLEHFFMGSVAEKVVRSAPCPVLTLCGYEKSSISTINKILVPIDFSDHSKNALLHAKHVASSYEAKIQLLHVIEESVHPSFYAAGETSVFKLMPKIDSISKQNLQKIFSEAGGPQVDVEFHIAEGRAANEIINFAENQNSRMIVMPTHGLTGFQHFLLGSVAEKVVRMAKCPVLTVKAFGKSLVQSQNRDTTAMHN